MPLVHLRWASLEALVRIEPRSALDPHGDLLVDRLVQLLAEPGQQQLAARPGCTEVALLFGVVGRLVSIPRANVEPLRLLLVSAACECDADDVGGAASATPAWPFQRMQPSPSQPDPSIVRRVLALLRRNCRSHIVRRPLLNEWVESIVPLLACHVTSAVRIAAIETLKMADGQSTSCRI